MANLLQQLEAEGYDTSQITPALIKQLKQEGYDTSGIEQPSKKSGILSRLGDTIEKANVPGRGFRGMAVGAENLLRPAGAAMLGPLGPPLSAGQSIEMAQNAPNALNRAAAAVQPGFEPQDAREGLAADIGYEGATAAMLPGIGKLVGRGFSAVSSPMRKGWNVLTRPGEKAARAIADQKTLNARQTLEEAKIGVQRSTRSRELMEAQERLSSAPDKYARAEIRLKGKLEQIKHTTSLAEKKAGLTIRDSSYIQNAFKTPEKLEQVASRAGRFVEKGPKYLSKNLSDKVIYREMKVAQEALKRPDLNQVQTRNFNDFNKTAREALGIRHPEIAKSLDEMGKVYKVLDQLPKAKAARVASLRAEVKTLTNKMKSNKYSWEDKELMARQQLNELQPQIEKLIADGVLTTSVRQKLGWAALAAVGLGGASKYIR